MLTECNIKYQNEEESMEEVENKLRLLENSISVENKVHDRSNEFRAKIRRLFLECDKHSSYITFLFQKRMRGAKMITLNKDITIYFKYQMYNYDLTTINENFVDILFYNIRYSQEMTPATKKNDWTRLKEFLRYCDNKFDFSKYKMPEPKSKLKYEDLITEPEFEIILNSKLNIEKKAFLCILRQSATRPGEVFSINRRSFIPCENNTGYLVTVFGKTGRRTIFLLDYIERINALLDTDWETWTFSYSTLAARVKQFEFRIGKRLYLYLFRHSRLTELAPVMTDSVLNPLAGWEENSKMRSNYVHLNNEAVLKAYKKARIELIDFK